MLLNGEVNYNYNQQPSLNFTTNQKISETIKTLFTTMPTKLKIEVYYEN